jgi:hypothetical protein
MVHYGVDRSNSIKEEPRLASMYYVITMFRDGKGVIQNMTASRMLNKCILKRGIISKNNNIIC